MNQQMMSMERFGNRDPQPVDPTTLELEAENFVLRRHGQRPLAFQGSELAMASSYVAGCAAWYELNIYKTVENDFVVRVHMYSNAPQQPEQTDAWRCAGLIEVFDTIEAWDASRTVRIELLPEEASLSVGELAASAVSIRSRIEEARHQYRTIVGEMLMDLDG
ncbi:MAG: hypothetical protein AAF526_01170 [Pseudomonadota bacterium]